MQTRFIPPRDPSDRQTQARLSSLMSRAASGALIGFLAGLTLGLFPAQRALAATRPLDALVQVDGLGYQCIPEDQLEAAFAASGKGAYLPQTCLPDPCTIEPEAETLNEILGRPATDEELAQFLQRHKMRCTHVGPVFPGGVKPYLPILSSTPYIERKEISRPTLPPTKRATISTPSILPPVSTVFFQTLPPLSGVFSVSAQPEEGDTPATVFGGVPPRSEGGTPSTMPEIILPLISSDPPQPLPPIAPVPIQGTLAMLLGALAVMRMTLLGRRRP